MVKTHWKWRPFILFLIVLWKKVRVPLSTIWIRILKARYIYILEENYLFINWTKTVIYFNAKKLTLVLLLPNHKSFAPRNKSSFPNNAHEPILLMKRNISQKNPTISQEKLFFLALWLRLKCMKEKLISKIKNLTSF